MDFSKLTNAIGELDEEGAISFIDRFISSNPGKEQAYEAVAACQKGMVIVSKLFDQKEYFVGDLIYAGELLNKAIEGLNSVLGDKQSGPGLGKIVLGTVEGDLHDIGKNIYKSLSEVAGFEVVDLGIDVKTEKFVTAVEREKPIILGLSGILTLAIDSMKNTVDALNAAGLRDGVKVIIGGNAVSKEVCELVGADAYTTNAAEGVNICKGWS